jgi:hypothetical protein
MSSWRITWRALAAVARKDAARDRLLSVFLYPWVLGSLVLVVGTSWIPDWLWDVVGIARLRPGSPEVILRTWFCVGLAPAIWLGTRANVLSESRAGGWKLLARLPVRPGLVLLGKALQGSLVIGALTGVGLLIAVTASSFREITGANSLAAAAGLAGAVFTLYTLCFLSGLLGRHRLLVWASVGSLFVSSGARLEALPGGALFRLPLGDELLRAGLVSLGVALGFLVLVTLLAGAREGRWLEAGSGPLRSVDLTRAGLATLVLLSPWALSGSSLPPVQLAGKVLRGSSGSQLEVEDLSGEGPEGQRASRALLETLSADLEWLAELGLEPAPLAVANEPGLRAGQCRARRDRSARGLVLDAAFGSEGFQIDSFRAEALSALLGERPGWGRGSTRLLALGLPELRARPRRPEDDLRAAWALQRIDEPLESWVERWEVLEREVGRSPARALARRVLEDFATRNPTGPEDWARRAARDPRSAPPADLLKHEGSAAWRERIVSDAKAGLDLLPSLEGISVEPAAGGLRYRARLVSGSAATVSSARLVLRATRTRTGLQRRAEALQGAPGFGGASDAWATLSLPPGDVEWQLGLALSGERGELVFASGRGSPQ